MVKVDGADATVKKVTSLGGKAKPAFDIMEQGRMAECRDPNGAAVRPLGAEEEPRRRRRQLATRRPELARDDDDRRGEGHRFYTALFGWKAEVMPMEGFEYTTFKLGDEPVAGMMAITPEMGPIPPHWAVYFTVDDVDRTVRQALALGATSCVPAQDIPGVGRFAGLTSPQGVIFYVITYTS